MNKQECIRIISNAAKLYRDNLENNTILFVFGEPNAFDTNAPFSSYEATFLRRNFKHLTGIKLKEELKEKINRNSEIKLSNEFYKKALSGRIKETDFEFANDGSTVQKLAILEISMNVKKNAMLFGDFTDYGVKLYTEKVTGTTSGCLGFRYAADCKFNIPNTLLNKDIRTVIKKPNKKIFAILYKHKQEKMYTHISKLDKAIIFEEYRFPDEVEKLIDRNSIQFDYQKNRQK